MKCEICGRGPSPENGGFTVHRQNEKGVKGIWRCDAHNMKPIDPAIAQILRALDPKPPEIIQ